MLKIAVCDDEEKIVKTICNMIEKNVNNEVSIDKFYNSFSIMEYYLKGIKKSLDILIIDVELGNDNGIFIASLIKKEYPNIKIIIVTGHVNYAEDIFETEPSYFLIKPVGEEKLVKALEKSFKEIKVDKQNSISISLKEGIIKIRISEIKYFESQGRYVLIHEKKLTRKVYLKLDDIEKELPLNFLRCHKSYIVNMDYIKEFRSKEILLFSDDIVHVSRPKYGEAKLKFLNYLGDKL